MTVLEALAILEAGVLECKKRSVDTPEVREALNFLEPHIRPKWLVPQYRHALDEHRNLDCDREGQQQVRRPTFEGIGNSVCNSLAMRLDELTREFAASADMKVKKEIVRLAKDYEKLKEPWRFVSK
jgi:hypothetical protein